MNVRNGVASSPSAFSRPLRVELAQWWSDHLDTLRLGATVVELRPRANASL